MSKEDFLEVLKENYAQRIYEAYLECEHDYGRIIEKEKLNLLLEKLFQEAKTEGLGESDFLDLVKSTLPIEVQDLKFFEKKAA